MKVVLVPLEDANHWSIIVMNDDNMYHYDSLESINIFHLLILHHFLSKIWAMKQGKPCL